CVSSSRSLIYASSTSALRPFSSAAPPPSATHPLSLHDALPICLRAIERARALLFLGGLGPVRIHPRQIDLEARAVPELAVEPDVAAALLHHAVHGRETEARALTHRLGREKGLEDPGVGLRVHAGPVVRD